MRMSFQSRLRVAVPAALLVAVLAARPTSQGAAATAAVDFAAGRSVNSASGVLYERITPPDREAAWIVPHRPRLWRYPSGPYSWQDVAQSVLALVPDVRLNLMLSAHWGYPLNNWNGHGAPWENWAAYETYITEVARWLRYVGVTGTLEVWNEPDIPMFWNGTRDQFHEMYARAYQKLRTELGPGAEIGGPTFGSYDHDAMAAFLEFCLARGCEVNALIFHAADDSPAGLAAYPANVRDARVSFLENPRYAPLRIQRIINNEIVGPLYTHQPAGTLAYYAAFEAGGAALAAHSCWPENFVGECDRTLDGLLTPGTPQPRSVWWAHSLYAAGVPSRVAATASTANLVVLGSAGSAPAPPQVLIGHVNFPRTVDRQPATLVAQLTMNHVWALQDHQRCARH